MSGYARIPRKNYDNDFRQNEGGWIHHTSDGKVGMLLRDFDSSLNYFHHANDHFNETEDVCNKTVILDLWDTDMPASDLNGTGASHYEEALFRDHLSFFGNRFNSHNLSTPL